MCEQTALEAIALLAIYESKVDVYRLMMQVAMAQLYDREQTIAALQRTNAGLRDDLRATYERMMS